MLQHAHPYLRHRRESVTHGRDITRRCLLWARTGPEAEPQTARPEPIETRNGLQHRNARQQLGAVVGIRNYLIEGVSCTGKTSAGEELQRRGYHVIHGDRDLAYWGDPETGESLDSTAYEHWIWDVEKIRALVADPSHAATFFCGGSRNLDRFIDLFDAVFVLEVDRETLNRRLALRPADEWGGPASDGESNARLQHATREGIPRNAVAIDATAPLARVVDAILEHVSQVAGQGPRDPGARPRQRADRRSPG